MRLLIAALVLSLAVAKSSYAQEPATARKAEPQAVAVALAHIDAWSHHDFEAARKNLAKDVHVTVRTTQPIMAPTDTIGVEKYMDGLTKFAQAVYLGALV